MRRGFVFLAVLAACGGSSSDWSEVPDGPSLLTASDVWAFSTTDVWVVDGRPMVHRYDGASWSTLATPGAAATCIFALDESQVWLCAGGDILFYDGADFETINVSGPAGLDGISDVWASSQTDIWAVGDDAVVAHYDGSAWTREIAGSPFKSSIWGSGPNDVYALSTFDLIHYDGSAWTEVDLESGGGDGQVWGTGARDVWVMTDSSEIGHYDGARWETIETFDFVGDLAAIWGPAPNDLWAAGSAGAIAHYDGSSWTEVTHQAIGSPFLRVFVAVHGTSSTDIWAVGYQLGDNGSEAKIFHYDP